MRTLFIIPLVLMSLVSFPSWGLTMDDLVHRDDLYFEKFSNVPFSGVVDEGLTRGSVKNGMKDGSWETYWGNGQLSGTGEYRNGKKDGFWTLYDPSGQVVLKHNYKLGTYHGHWESYHEDGDLFEKGELKNGSRHGRWISYFPNGDLNTSFSGQFKNGVKVSD